MEGIPEGLTLVSIPQCIRRIIWAEVGRGQGLGPLLHISEASDRRRKFIELYTHALFDILQVSRELYADIFGSFPLEHEAGDTIGARSCWELSALEAFPLSRFYAILPPRRRKGMYRWLLRHAGLLRRLEYTYDQWSDPLLDWLTGDEALDALLPLLEPAKPGAEPLLQLSLLLDVAASDESSTTIPVSDRARQLLASPIGWGASSVSIDGGPALLFYLPYLSSPRLTSLCLEGIDLRAADLHPLQHLTALRFSTAMSPTSALPVVSSLTNLRDLTMYTLNKDASDPYRIEARGGLRAWSRRPTFTASRTHPMSVGTLPRASTAVTPPAAASCRPSICLPAWSAWPFAAPGRWPCCPACPTSPS